MGAIARFYKGRPVTSVQSGSDCASEKENRRPVSRPGAWFARPLVCSIFGVVSTPRVGRRTNGLG